MKGLNEGKYRITKMNRAELIRSYSQMEGGIWPESLGKAPWAWRHGPAAPINAAVDKIYPSRMTVRSEIVNAILLELGTREIEQVQNDRFWYFETKRTL